MTWPLSNYSAVEELVSASLDSPPSEAVRTALQNVFQVGSNDGAASMYVVLKQQAAPTWPGVHLKATERAVRKAVRPSRISLPMRSAIRFVWLAGFSDGMRSVFHAMEADPDLTMPIGRGCKVTPG